MLGTALKQVVPILVACGRSVGVVVSSGLVAKLITVKIGNTIHGSD